jgi:cytochrome c
MRWRTALAAALLGPLAASAHAADPVAGERAFAQCAACHATTASAPPNALGPTLHGVVGRKAAAVDGFRYSPAMTRSGLVWDSATLDRFLQDPQATIRGNRMPFAGIENAAERANLVAYMQTLSR